MRARITHVHAHTQKERPSYVNLAVGKVTCKSITFISVAFGALNRFGAKTIPRFSAVIKFSAEHRLTRYKNAKRSRRHVQLMVGNCPTHDLAVSANSGAAFRFPEKVDRKPKMKRKKRFK